MPSSRGVGRWAVLVLATLCLSLEALGAPTPDCTAATLGSDGSCPAACRSKGLPLSFQRCKACALSDPYASATMQQHLSCSQCKAGYRRVELDSYQIECLTSKELQCATFAPQLPGSFNSLDGPCASCGAGTVPVYAANPGSFQFAEGFYSAKRVCRRCSQLGCPGRCRKDVGCVACPPGSVLLRGLSPPGASRWIGQAPTYNLGSKPPVLPGVCVKISRLGCPGKARHYKGCTACPPGKELRRVSPQRIQGSIALRFYANGSMCR